MSIEVLLQAQALAWQTGKPVSIEDLLNRQSIDQQSLSHDDLLSLICNEVRLRERAGESPTLAEFQERFPALAHKLETQWEIDAFLVRELNEELVGGENDECSSDLPDYLGRYEVIREIARGVGCRLRSSRQSAQAIGGHQAIEN